MSDAKTAPMPDDTRRDDPAATARHLFDAFARADRDTAERLIAGDFHFTSPNDNALDRAAYFATCWPQAGPVLAFDLLDVVAAGDRVFVTYEAHDTEAHRFRNTEVLTIRGGQVRSVEVYFGWTLPHPVERGRHRQPA